MWLDIIYLTRGLVLFFSSTFYFTFIDGLWWVIKHDKCKTNFSKFRLKYACKNPKHWTDFYNVYINSTFFTVGTEVENEELISEVEGNSESKKTDTDI